MYLLEVAMCEKCRSSHFKSEGGVKSLTTGGGGGVKNCRAGGVTDLGGYFSWGVSTSLHVMFYIALMTFKINCIMCM